MVSPSTNRGFGILNWSKPAFPLLEEMREMDEGRLKALVEEVVQTDRLGEFLTLRMSEEEGDESFLTERLWPIFEEAHTKRFIGEIQGNHSRFFTLSLLFATLPHSLGILYKEALHAQHDPEVLVETIYDYESFRMEEKRQNLAPRAFRRFFAFLTEEEKQRVGKVLLHKPALFCWSFSLLDEDQQKRCLEALVFDEESRRDFCVAIEEKWNNTQSFIPKFAEVRQALVLFFDRERINLLIEQARSPVQVNALAFLMGLLAEKWLQAKGEEKELLTGDCDALVETLRSREEGFFEGALFKAMAARVQGLWLGYLSKEQGYSTVRTLPQVRLRETGLAIAVEFVSALLEQLTSFEDKLRTMSRFITLVKWEKPQFVPFLLNAASHSPDLVALYFYLQGLGEIKTLFGPHDGVLEGRVQRKERSAILRSVLPRDAEGLQKALEMYFSLPERSRQNFLILPYGDDKGEFLNWPDICDTFGFIDSSVENIVDDARTALLAERADGEAATTTLLGMMSSDIQGIPPLFLAFAYQLNSEERVMIQKLFLYMTPLQQAAVLYAVPEKEFVSFVALLHPGMNLHAYESMLDLLDEKRLRLLLEAKKENNARKEEALQEILEEAAGLVSQLEEKQKPLVWPFTLDALRTKCSEKFVRAQALSTFGTSHHDKALLACLKRGSSFTEELSALDEESQARRERMTARIEQAKKSFEDCLCGVEEPANSLPEIFYPLFQIKLPSGEEVEFDQWPLFGIVQEEDYRCIVPKGEEEEAQESLQRYFNQDDLVDFWEKAWPLGKRSLASLQKEGGEPFALTKVSLGEGLAKRTKKGGRE